MTTTDMIVYTHPALKLTDRCDQCNAQAFVRLTNASVAGVEGVAELLMCGHHATEHELALMADGWVPTTDARSTINGTPGTLSAEVTVSPAEPTHSEQIGDI